MVPVDSVGVPRDPTYSGTLREVIQCRLRDCHPLWPAFPVRFDYQITFLLPCGRPYNPAEENLRGLGYFRFARRYSGNRVFFLLLRLLRCFSSPRSPRTPMYSAYASSGIPGSTLVCQLPRAFRRLPRPSTPPDAKTSPMRP